MNSFINVFFSILFTLFFSITAYSAQDEQNSFETDIYSLKIPKYIRQLNPPADVIGERNNKSFAFVYGETDEKSKKIFIIIDGEKNSSITRSERSYALHTITATLKDKQEWITAMQFILKYLTKTANQCVLNVGAL
jgi:hypothetical protein